MIKTFFRQILILSGMTIILWGEKGLSNEAMLIFNMFVRQIKKDWR